ncbi:nitrate reductase [Photobacterium damselae subsp. piscicida]|uniref:Chaperone NapD n=1 Tax=Photobacterium damsela subsp. piscicida TaxID=38294 RepID=A0A1Q9H6L3_PHODP|nr:chaperone NapD [Photobacterium damselae]MBE8129847.1 chaperone NapD [Photobacterium damselae subsp. piscicida]MDP2516622.1 chaperone NapD [Photobacterium damselae subsp. piscicida]MDP2533259.1 chaperone NapD [Photobacterium damselae subsp. piscicida]MDP2545429.1 chaperone NapD [Photobacterium damselae subsp. piscicida]MDP2559317.1 chaperone NapD [Photobacterium damselae subsp. piscicida]
MAVQEVHISSLVVHVNPEYLPQVKEQILQLPNTEIYGDSVEGKVVVVLETENQGYVTDTIDKINNLDHVLATFWVYHQIEHFETQSEDNA